MKKLIFLLIPLLLTSLACAPVISDIEKERRVAPVISDIEKERRVAREQARKEAEFVREQARKDAEFVREVDVTDAELVEVRAWYRKLDQEQRKRVKERALAEEARVEALRKQQKLEQEAKYKRFKEECVEFIKNEDGSLKNKTTQEVKKLVDQWNYYWTDHLIERMGEKWVWELAFQKKEEHENVSNLEIFYKIFGKPWKTQFIEDRYVLWYICKGGNALITVSEDSFDDDWILILDLNIL